MRDLSLWMTIGSVLFALVACAAGSVKAPEIITVTSPEFGQGEAIPRRFSCQGEDLSPALSWSGLPDGAKAVVLICDDPDAPMGTWVHWVLYNLPAAQPGLPEGVSTAPKLPSGALQGKNSWGKTGYGGPCPPPGKAHRYFFTLYALSAPLSLEAGATKAEVLHAMGDGVLAKGTLMGTYKR